MLRLLLITLVLMPTATLGQTITCKVSTNFSCEAASCAPAHLGTWRVIDLSKKTYSYAQLSIARSAIPDYKRDKDSGVGL